MDNMKILVTGATGFLGGWVLKHLASVYGKKDITGTGRNPDKLAELSAEGYSMKGGDLLDRDFIEREFSKCTCVIHCAALSSPWGPYEEFYRHNVLTTKYLLEKIPRISSFVYISSPMVYFNFTDRFMVSEYSELPEKPVNAYAATKRLAELDVLNHVNPNMIRTIIRPRAIIGAGDTVVFPRVIRAYKSGRLRIIGDGKNTGDFSSARNIAHAVALCLEAGKDIDRKIFNITDDEPREIWTLLMSTLAKMGLDPELKKISYGTIHLMACLSEFIARNFTGKEPVLTKYSVGILNFSLTLDISEAKKYLGYEPIVTTDQSIGEFLTWYHENMDSHP